MSLFGGHKSSSSSQTTTVSDQKSATFGELSSGNLNLADSNLNINKSGLNDAELENILNFQQKVFNRSLDLVQSQGQAALENSTQTTNEVLKKVTEKEKNDTQKFLESATPIALIVLIIWMVKK